MPGLSAPPPLCFLERALLTFGAPFRNGAVRDLGNSICFDFSASEAPFGEGFQLQDLEEVSHGSEMRTTPAFPDSGFRISSFP